MPLAVFDGLPDDTDEATNAILARDSTWMATEKSCGGLFHAAVAADPNSNPLREHLERHNAEVASRAAAAIGVVAAATELLAIIEGLTQA